MKIQLLRLQFNFAVILLNIFYIYLTCIKSEELNKKEKKINIFQTYTLENNQDNMNNYFLKSKQIYLEFNFSSDIVNKNSEINDFSNYHFFCVFQDIENKKIDDLNFEGKNTFTKVHKSTFIDNKNVGNFLCEFPKNQINEMFGDLFKENPNTSLFEKYFNNLEFLILIKPKEKNILFSNENSLKFDFPTKNRSQNIKTKILFIFHMSDYEIIFGFSLILIKYKDNEFFLNDKNFIQDLIKNFPFKKIFNKKLRYLCPAGQFPSTTQPTSCFISPPIGYYLKSSTNIYEPCDVSCQSCTTSKTNCSTCNEPGNFFALIDNANSCNNSNSIIIGYFYDNPTKKFQKCDISCDSCSSQPSNCSACKATYYPLQNFNTICKLQNESPLGYFFDSSSNIHKLCDGSCQTCVSSLNYCTKCASNFFPLIDNANYCYTISPPGYVLDPGAGIHKKCDVSCQLCRDLPTNCYVCNNDYFSNYGTLFPCFYRYMPPDSSYLDQTKSVYVYKKCHTLCKTCEMASTNTANNCRTCITGYYKKIDDSVNCFIAPIDNYYFNSILNIFSKCYSSCKTCLSDGDGNATDHRCISCTTGYYFLSGKRNCYTGVVANYYYDPLKFYYLPCYGSCQSCNGGGTISNHMCITCRDGFYPLEDIKANCYIKSEEIPLYYFKDLTNSSDVKGQVKTTGIFNRCYSTCGLCTKGGDAKFNNCLKCKTGFYKSIDSENNCFGEIREKYYLFYDEILKEKIFYPCYKGCFKCSGSPIKDNHQCLMCDNKNSYFLSDIDNTNCYFYTEGPYGYYFSNISYKFTKCEDLKTNYFNSTDLNSTININSTNTEMKLTSFIPNFFDLKSSFDVQIKFSNYISFSDPKYKIVDLYLSANLKNGLNMKYGLVIKGFDCNILYAYFHPPLKIEGISKKKKFFNSFLQENKNNTANSLYKYYDHLKNSRILQNDNSTFSATGRFQIYVLNGNREFINTDMKNLQVVISETSIPSFLSETVFDISSTFQYYLKTNNFSGQIISKNSKNQTIQAFSFSDNSVKDAYSLSLENGVSYFDLGECITYITQYYNKEYIKLNSTVVLKKEDIVVLKIDDYPKIMNPFSNYIGYRNRLYLFNSLSSSKEQIDLNICYGKKITSYLPINPYSPNYSPINLTYANYFKFLYKADIYNENDRIYTDICYKFSNNSIDVTIYDRRREIYPKISILCSVGCEFGGIVSEIGYLKCICQPSATSSIIMNYFDKNLDYISMSNLNLFTCLSTVFEVNSISKNIGLIISVVFFFLKIFNFFIFLIFPSMVEKFYFNQEKNNTFNYYNNDEIVNNDKIFNNEENNMYILQINCNCINNLITRRKKTDNIQRNIDLHVKNLNILKKIKESDGCFFQPIDAKLKRKYIRENLFEDNSPDNNEENKNNLENHGNHLDLLKKRKFRMKFLTYKNGKDLDNDIITKNKSTKYKIKKNGKFLKIKAKFIKKERENPKQDIIIDNKENNNFNNGKLIFNIFLFYLDIIQNSSDRNILIQKENSTKLKKMKNQTVIENTHNILNNKNIENLNKGFGLTEQNKNSNLNQKKINNGRNEIFKDITLIQVNNEHSDKENHENSINEMKEEEIFKNNNNYLNNYTRNNFIRYQSVKNLHGNFFIIL